MLKYVFDNSSLLVMFNHFYIDRFPTLWGQFDFLVQNERILFVRELYNEIVRRSVCEKLVNWTKEHRTLFVEPTVVELDFVRQIFDNRHFQSLIERKRILEGHPVADPFLIAKAKIENAFVVTQEEYKKNAAKIPNVCEFFKIDWTNLEGFMQKESWKY